MVISFAVMHGGWLHHAPSTDNTAKSAIVTTLSLLHLLITALPPAIEDAEKGKGEREILSKTNMPLPQNPECHQSFHGLCLWKRPSALLMNQMKQRRRITDVSLP